MLSLVYYPGAEKRNLIFNMSPIRKIVILGPESTGKSTLCEALAKHYHTVWCPEYARQYLSENGTDYTY